MHGAAGGPHHPAPKCLPYALVPHADTKQGEFLAQFPDGLQGDARVFWAPCATAAELLKQRPVAGVHATEHMTVVCSRAGLERHVCACQALQDLSLHLSCRCHDQLMATIPGPGETRTPSGLIALISSTVFSSFLRTM